MGTDRQRNVLECLLVRQHGQDAHGLLFISLRQLAGYGFHLSLNGVASIQWKSRYLMNNGIHETLFCFTSFTSHQITSVNLMPFKCQCRNSILPSLFFPSFYAFILRWTGGTFRLTVQNLVLEGFGQYMQ